jgi:ankyrin repeat protein
VASGTLFPARRWIWAALLALVTGAPSTASAAADDIHEAAYRGDLATVQRLIAGDKSLLNARTSSQETPLHRAAQAGQVEVVRFLIGQGVEVNATAYNGFTPLSLTTGGSVAKLLIDAGADLNRKDNWGKTPLQGALQERHAEVVDAIVASGYSIDLTSAVMMGRTDLVRAILDKDPASAKRPTAGSDLWGNTTPLGIAAGKGNREVVELLLKAGADVNEGTMIPTAGGDATPLCNAVWAGHADIVELLCEHGANPTGAGGKFYRSILDWALQHAEATIVAVLVKYGALEANGHPGFGGTTSPLSAAARRGDARIVRLLLDAKGVFGAEDRQRALLNAAIGQHADIVAILRGQGATYDLVTAAVLGDEPRVRECLAVDPAAASARDGILHRSALAWALESRHMGIAAILIDAGASVNDVVTRPAMDDALQDGALRAGSPGAGSYLQVVETPLLIAVESGEAAAVRLLLEHQADANVAGGMDALSPLHLAAQQGRADLVDLLLRHGANVDASDKRGVTPLHNAVASPAVTAMLLKHGADARAKTTDGKTAIDWAMGNPEVSELLLRQGAPLTMSSACRLGRSEFVAEAVRADPQAATRQCEEQSEGFPLLIAAEAGQVAVVRVLLDAGADVNAGDMYQKSALHHAATGGSVPVARLLLERGAKLHAMHNQGEPIHHAAMFGHLDVVKFLLERGADVNVEAPGGGWTPLGAVAAWSDSAEVAEFLISRGAEPNHRDQRSGETALHQAAQRGSFHVARVLLEHSADVNAKDGRGMTPLAWAERETSFDDETEKTKKAEVAALLRSRGGTK